MRGVKATGSRRIGHPDPGDITAVDRAGGNLVIKLSGVPYDAMKSEQMIVESIATETLCVKPSAEPMPHVLHEKHFPRKHGPQAFNGQESS